MKSGDGGSGLHIARKMHSGARFHTSARWGNEGVEPRRCKARPLLQTLVFHHRLTRQVRLRDQDLGNAFRVPRLCRTIESCWNAYLWFWTCSRVAARANHFMSGAFQSCQKSLRPHDNALWMFVKGVGHLRRTGLLCRWFLVFGVMGLRSVILVC